MASQAAADPSMEEILASIRKIIAEDGDPDRQQSHRLAVVPEPRAGARRSPETDSGEMANRAEASRSGYADEDIGEMAEDDYSQGSDQPDLDDDLSALEDGDEGLREGESAEVAMDEADAVGNQQPIWNADHDGGIQDADADAAQQADADEPQSVRRTPAMDRLEAMMAEGSARGAAAATRTLLSPRSDEAVQSAFNQLADIILSEQTRTLEDLVKEMMQPMLRHWLDDNLPVLVERLVREEIERVSRGRR